MGLGPGTILPAELKLGDACGDGEFAIFCECDVCFGILGISMSSTRLFLGVGADNISVGEVGEAERRWSLGELDSELGRWPARGEAAIDWE